MTDLSLQGSQRRSMTMIISSIFLNIIFIKYFNYSCKNKYKPKSEIEIERRKKCKERKKKKVRKRKHIKKWLQIFITSKNKFYNTSPLI